MTPLCRPYGPAPSASAKYTTGRRGDRGRRRTGALGTASSARMPPWGSIRPTPGLIDPIGSDAPAEESHGRHRGDLRLRSLRPGRLGRPLPALRSAARPSPCVPPPHTLRARLALLLDAEPGRGRAQCARRLAHVLLRRGSARRHRIAGGRQHRGALIRRRPAPARRDPLAPGPGAHPAAHRRPRTPRARLRHRDRRRGRAARPVRRLHRLRAADPDDHHVRATGPAPFRAVAVPEVEPRHAGGQRLPERTGAGGVGRDERLLGRHRRANDASGQAPTSSRSSSKPRTRVQSPSRTRKCRRCVACCTTLHRTPP